MNYTIGARQPGKLRGLACIQNEEVEEIKQRSEHEEQGAGEQGGREGGGVGEAGRVCLLFQQLQEAVGDSQMGEGGGGNTVRRTPKSHSGHVIGGKRGAGRPGSDCSSSGARCG